MAIAEYLLAIAKALLPFRAFFFKCFAGVRFTDPPHHSQLQNRTFWVEGKYRCTFGRTLMLFHVHDHNYYPQGPAVMNPTHKSWRKDISVGPIANHAYTVVVAAVSKDFLLVTDYFGRVHELLLERNPPIDTWLPFQMFPDRIPAGFIELDRIVVTHA